MAQTKGRIFSRLQRGALLSGAMILIDEPFDDLCQYKRFRPNTCPRSAAPARYSEVLVKTFVVSMVRAGDRLATWEGREIPASTAESLALEAIIEEAREWLIIKSEEEGREGKVGLERFMNDVFSHLGFELLFNPVWDGIEDTDAAKEIDMSLKAGEWLNSVYAPVHRCFYL